MHAVAFFGAVPRSILYDNDRCLVVRIMPDGTPGTPGDTQLFTYLLDTDVFVSADKGILQIIEEARPFSSVDLPKGLLIKGGREGVETLLSELTAVPNAI